jgi:hypothetical protein
MKPAAALSRLFWATCGAIPAALVGFTFGMGVGERDAEILGSSARDAAVTQCSKRGGLAIQVTDAKDRRKDAWRCIGGSNRVLTLPHNAD